MGFSAGTMAQVGIGSQIAGGAMSTIGAYSQAQAQRSLLTSQANIDDINARLSDAAAQSARESGSRQVQASRLATARLKSSQRASLAANGVDLSVGSAAEQLTSTDVLGEMDANTLEANALRSAWGYRMQGVNYRNDALMRRAGADAISPWLAAGSSLLTSAGNVAASWYNYKKGG